jgi:hypothetical protein
MNDTTKSAGRTFAESIYKKVADRYTIKALAEILVETGSSVDVLGGGEARTHADKAAMLDASHLVFMKMVLSDRFPSADDVRAACLPAVLDSDKMGDNEDMVRGIVASSVDLLHDLNKIYIHEFSHSAAGDTYGFKSDVAVLAFPQIAEAGDVAFALGLSVRGGRCMFGAGIENVTPEQRAVISVAGLMGEKLCTSIKGMGTDPTRDTEYWLKVFSDIHEAGDPDTAKEGTSPAVLHSGAWKDTEDLYRSAPTIAQREAAILAAGEIIAAQCTVILAKATQRSIAHTKTLGDVLTLMTTAMEICDAAACGEYGSLLVTKGE